MRHFLLFLLLAAPARGTELSLTLRAAEESALAVSNQYRAARLSAEAAAAAARAADSPLYPRFSLEGSLRYFEVVPAITMPAALGGSRPLGDNWNYSLGPSAYWTLFDGGALRSGREAAVKTAAARSAEAENVRRQALLRARGAYFQLQLALERVYLIGENLQLSLSQLKDISLGAKAGARSRLDEIRARQETLARRRDFLRARAELSAELREFGFLTGLDLPAGASLPTDSRLAGRDYGEGQEAELFIRAEPYTEILRRLLPAASGTLEKALPSVRAAGNSAQAQRALASGYKAGRLPRLALGARSSLDYPNGPNLYSFVQNSASLSLNLPLFEKGRSAEKERESGLNAEAAAEKKSEAALLSEKDYKKNLDAYNALLAEQSINIAAVDDAGEASGLAYDAYKAGGGTWLDVESANLKELQAKTLAATANAEILIRLAVLDSLNGSVK
ncbi:MAG: TolC family protein [Elusimicrobia bacterium]|nr:TolC family protein [Elusimicrobiota bacterium]